MLVRIQFVLLLSLLVGLGSSRAEAQTLTKEGDRYELAFVSADPGKAHDSANAFADEVGKTLKSLYPSKVVDPSVELRVFLRDGKNMYRIIWSCRIVKASVSDADYYFDRRGTLLPGSTLSEAKRNVEAEIERSQKVSSMRKNFPQGKIPEPFIQETFSGTAKEGYWYLKEFFLVAPKQSAKSR